jgi:hypothetical protein
MFADATSHIGDCASLMCRMPTISMPLEKKACNHTLSLDQISPYKMCSQCVTNLHSSMIVASALALSSARE